MKRLPVLILLIFLFVIAKSQTQADSLNKLPADTGMYPSVDTPAMHLKANSAAVKHLHTDSVAKHQAGETIIRHSLIKTLSDKKYNAYLNGEDLDSMAMVGEMNHYPLPDKALKYKVQIGLNPGQITKLKSMAAELHRKKVEMGENIIRNEKMLDSLFHSKQIVDGTLIFYTNRSGLYLGELRGAILMTCFKTEKILSDDQIKRLEALEKEN